MCIGGLCGRCQMGNACSFRCDLLPGMDEKRGNKHRPFPVGVFQLLRRISQLRRSRQPPPPNPCTWHRFWHDVLSRPEQMHTSSHLGRSYSRTSAAENLNRLSAPSGQGYPETHSEAACARSCLNRASPSTVGPGPTRVHLLSCSNRGVDPGLYPISPRSEVAFSGVSPSPPFSRPYHVDLTETVALLP